MLVSNLSYNVMVQFSDSQKSFFHLLKGHVDMDSCLDLGNIGHVLIGMDGAGVEGCQMRLEDR